MIYDLQKATITKRVSAFLLDFILLLIVFTGSMWLISAITGYDNYNQGLQDRLISIQEKYDISELEKEHGVSFNDFQYMTEEEVEALPNEVKEAFKACRDEMGSDEEAIKNYEMIMSLSLVMISLGLLIAFAVVEFVIPLFFGNGQTLGKKIFSIAVMRVDGVKITPMILFIRTILGKYTIGTMVPVLMIIMLMFGSNPLIPTAIILLVLLLQVVFLITTRTNSLIHDSLASTVVVDFLSQMIFDSVEAKNEYKLRIHEEEASKADY